jgi:hypothetical protein
MQNNRPSHNLSNIWTGAGDEDHKHAYGEHVVVTRMGRINIIHTDNPSEETIKKRIDEVLHEEIDGDPFDDDCPLCQEFKLHPYDVVYTGEE